LDASVRARRQRRLSRVQRHRARFVAPTGSVPQQKLDGQDGGRVTAAAAACSQPYNIVLKSITNQRIIFGQYIIMQYIIILLLLYYCVGRKRYFRRVSFYMKIIIFRRRRYIFMSTIVSAFTLAPFSGQPPNNLGWFLDFTIENIVI